VRPRTPPLPEALLKKGGGRGEERRVHQQHIDERPPEILLLSYFPTFICTAYAQSGKPKGAASKALRREAQGRAAHLHEVGGEPRHLLEHKVPVGLGYTIGVPILHQLGQPGQLALGLQESRERGVV